MIKYTEVRFSEDESKMIRNAVQNSVRSRGSRRFKSDNELIHTLSRLVLNTEGFGANTLPPVKDYPIRRLPGGASDDPSGLPPRFPKEPVEIPPGPVETEDTPGGQQPPSKEMQAFTDHAREHGFTLTGLGMLGPLQTHNIGTDASPRNEKIVKVRLNAETWDDVKRIAGENDIPPRVVIRQIVIAAFEQHVDWL